ncbi:two-component system sensor histidine kinase/response regulator [Rhizobium sp. Leaf371]|uniref:PAS domain-containing protein n=1 Tax=Rhizobium sp. Leaf371 TaxID=1736355 RepID=UPI0007128C69|nr:PAS domain-containing protein [Rhizobium sp. Leaf371]KQS63829.1 two-component system sensor histidine kinase/response regulator [Rhizobium sp. Leaf371]
MSIGSSKATWPFGGGELGGRIRDFDWASTSLGPMSTWPPNLRIKVNSMINSPIPQVLMWGPDHVMIYNDGYREIAGGNHPSALGGKVPEIWPEIWDWNSRILSRGLQGEVQSFRDQPLVLNRNGRPEEIVFDLFYTPIYNDEGAVDGVLCTVLENTDRVRAVRALAESQAELSRISDALPILVGFLDVDHIYRFANKGYLDWFGHPASAVVGRHIGEIIGEDYYRKRLPFLDRAFAGEPVVTDTVIRRPGGDDRTAEVRYLPRMTDGGTVDGIYILLIDIEDRKRAERELVASNDRFRAAVRAVHGVLWTNSADGRMIGPQPGWAELTGQAYEAYQDYGWADAVHPDDRQATVEAWNGAVAHRHTFIWEHRVRRHDGAWRMFAIRGVPIFDEQGDITEWVGVHTDISDQRQAEDELRRHAVHLERQVRHRQRAEEQLRLLNETLEARVGEEIAIRRQAERALQQAQKMETIGKLTGGVAHDFNNLLQVVSGNLQLLSKDVAGNERAERRVANALAGVSRGAKLASQLLAFGRRQALEPKVINVGRFMSGMDDLLRRSIGEAIELETIVAGGLWNTFVDPVQVENAVLNLAINARDAMEGNGKLTIEVGNAYLDDDYARNHAEVEAGQYVVLSVSDTGSGIAPEVLEQVFEPFFSTKAEGKGSGLGLSMVYGFVKQSGGHVKIYSEVGHGTTVKLYLPRATAGEDREVTIQSGPVVGGTEMILVVEDDDEVRNTVVEMLSDLGYGVLKATNAQNALSVVESGIAIDLLFTDVVMPGPLKSVEMARKAKERLPDIAVLFTSGYTENSIVHGGRLDAGVELLSKPYTREALARKIRHVIANQKQRSAMNMRVSGTIAPGLDASGAATSHPAAATSDAPIPAAPVSVPLVTRAPEPAPLTVLVVEDDPLIRANTVELVEDFGHAVIEAGSAREARERLADRTIDVLVTDLGLPDASGADLAAEALATNPSLGIVFATGNDHAPDRAPPDAVLLRKPYDADGLEAAIKAAVRRATAT